MSAFSPQACAGRVALVTGGGSGIGFEIARQLGLHGAKLVIMGRRQAVLEQSVAALKADKIDAVFATGDVRRPDDAKAAVALAVSTFGGLNVLVNCAAGNFLSTAEELSTNAFRTVIDIDTVGTFNMSTAAFPHLKNNNGVVLNISANLHLYATWFQAHASAAKAAVDSLTRSLALEWGRYNIRVVGIAPGPIADTPGMTKLSGDNDAKLAQAVPLGRYGTKVEMGQVAVFLVSNAGGYVTGHTVIADGGAYLHRAAPISPEKVSEWSRALSKIVLSMVVRSSVELAAMEAVRAATAFLAADLAAAPKSCRKRPQTAIGIRGRLRASFSSASTRDGLSSLQDSATTEPRGTMTAWLTSEKHLETLLHARTRVQNAVRELGTAARLKQSLALDLTLPELKMLHAALGSQTNAYLEELYRCFRRLRLHMASCPAERKKQLDAMFESNARFHSRADVEALLAKQQDTTNAMSPLSDRKISMMMTHCDTQGTTQVDMRLFLELLQTVSSPRETLLGHVFRIVCPHAAVEKTSSQLRIFKLLALVKETATRHPDAAADVLQWLQSHASEATMSKHVWLSFHRVQSDQFQDDKEFLLYLDRVWNFIALGAKSTDGACASYAALLSKRDESSAASKTLVRMEKLERELDSLVERMTTTTRDFAQSSAQLEGITVPGHLLHLASSAVLEKASIALRHVQNLTIEPVASTIPKELHLPSLVRLNVAHVGLSALPDSLAELVHLQELKASHNQLTASSFPSSLRQWIHLTSVDLSANKLTAVPSVMEHWRALKQVDLSSNNIVKLPETFVWPHLTSLSLHDNRLVALPESLEGCHALMELICHRNALTRLPKALACLVHLKEATWHYNQLAMDHEDASWPSLERLVDIARFSLGHNCLRRLPAALTHLVGLQVCALGHNDLRDLSSVDFSTLVHCVEVDLRQNRLAHLPPSLFRMPKLSLLSVQGNILVAIPDELQGAPALLCLHANGNRISKLPRELNASLEHLDLSDNLIMTIPPTWASKRPRNQRHGGALQTLKLHDNPLESALQQVVDDQVYTARSTEQLDLAIGKLVDGVERSTSKGKVDFMTFQRKSARNRKEFDLKVRKGQAKQAVEFIEWSFRDVAKVVDCGMEYVAVASFQAVLTAVGAPWTHYEWRRVLKAFQQPKKPLVDVERFLTALETLHDAKPATRSFPAALFAFLERTAAEEVQRPQSVAPPRTIVSPPKPAVSPVKRKKKDASRVAGRLQSSAPPTDVSRLRLKKLQDKWMSHDVGQTPRKSAVQETKSTDLPVMDKAETPREEDVIPMEMATPQPKESLRLLPPTTEEEKRQEDPV
ncbi:hypothetical protein LEN26_010763 [Aphanomyces euteiches]|nr:hypothetical protein LEN26_010763 [Aphanomyces euteiches]